LRIEQSYGEKHELEKSGDGYGVVSLYLEDEQGLLLAPFVSSPAFTCLFPADAFRNFWIEIMEGRKGHGRMSSAVTGELLYSFHQLSINRR
jgi:hypothetical protein